MGRRKIGKNSKDDGLDEVDQVQLNALQAKHEDDGDEEGSDNSDEEEGSDSEEGSEVDSSEEDESEPEVEREKIAGAAPKVSVQAQEEEEVALDDAESIDEDAVPRQKIITNNKIALERIRDTIKLDPSLPWTETLAVTYPESITADVNDDLNRELAFYKQALHSANAARTLASQHNLPFTRPPDYFAEMVKSDAHMERIRQRLLDESATIKRAEEKRKEREGKKYGKQVQLEKIKERERSKKEMEQRLKGLKRKHKDAIPSAEGEDDAFDVAVEDAISDRPSKRPKPSSSSSSTPNQNRKAAKLPRKARDAKFGFGGKGRRDKQNTRESTEKFDFAVGKGKGNSKGKSGGGNGGKKGKQNRPGKSRRAAIRSR